MRAVVVYESMYGNTHLIADAIDAGLEAAFHVSVVPVSHAGPEVIADATGRRPSDQRRGRHRSHREGRYCAAEGWERCHVRVRAWCIIEIISAMLIGTASAVAMFIPAMCLVVEIPSK